MIVLRPDELTIVLEIIKKHIPQERVAAFGSRANGKARKTSDLDLAVMTAKPLPTGVLTAKKDAFSESRLPFRVDILDWSVIGDEFKKTIEKDMAEIYKPKG
ncbi:MAG: nucleotidyltransferase domain-containing protein [Patescibacteria group bacterium]|jgi:predicted nucleotidyltransferase